MGKYVETLSSGGELVVTESSWEISYYFPGPDLRYRGTFFLKFMTLILINILMHG